VKELRSISIKLKNLAVYTALKSLCWSLYRGAFFIEKRLTNLPQSEPLFDVDMDNPSSSITAEMQSVYMGNAVISCPQCSEPTEEVLMGLATLEDSEEERGEDGLPNMIQMGVISFPCGDTFCSACFTNKVANILNAKEEGRLQLSMLINLVECEEHGSDAR